MAGLHGTKLVFISVASRLHLSTIHSYANAAISELARPQGTKLRFKISNLSGCLHAKKLRSVLEPFGRVLYLSMRSPQKSDNINQEKSKADFGTSAVCIMEVPHGKTLPGKLAWTLGGKKVTMPINLLPLDPQVQDSKQNGSVASERSQQEPGKQQQILEAADQIEQPTFPDPNG